jgi:hypothetical protein
MANPKKDQIAIAEKLQLKLLEYFEKKLENNTLTDTGAATLARLLMQNGWNLDPSAVPEGLRSKLTQNIDPNELNEDDLDRIAGAIGV